jgi:YhgE/Pip-like protein
MRAAQLLKIRPVWLSPSIIASVLIFLITLIYIGSVVNPLGHLRGLPVLIVNEDVGATAGGTPVKIGDQVVSGLQGSSAVTDRLSLKSVTLEQATKELNHNAAYLAVVIPAEFSGSLLSLYGAAPASAASVSSTSSSATSVIPRIQLMTNVRSGSVGASLATNIVSPALAAISTKVGSQLSAQSAGPPTSANAYRANPITVTTTPFRPLPSHSALGLSAFYLSLLTIMCGFLGAVLVNSTVDSALGYATNEVGPKWQQRAPVHISRWQTLLAKWAFSLGVVPLLTSIMLVVAIAILKMDATHIPTLWVFTTLAALAVAVGTLVLFAALGALGQLVAMLVFIYLALASSGGTTPLQALPPTLRFSAHFEPLRQILDGVRAILYFDAAGPAGLTRGFIMSSVGLVFWLVIGVAVTTWYDRRKFYRIQPDLLAYVNESARTYKADPDRKASPDRT